MQNGPERLCYYGNISAVGLLYQAPVHPYDLSVSANHEGSHHLSHSHDLNQHMAAVHVIPMYFLPELERVLWDADVERVEDVLLHSSKAFLVVTHPEASVIKSI